MSTTQGIKLDDNTQARLKSLAAKRNRTPHWLMRSAIEDYLVREEQYEKEKAEDMSRWERYLLTGEAIEHEKVEPWLKDLATGKDRPWQG
ncbi:MAG TPA: ribbon-helix-helix protein, CopG family [Candidatus Saccharimonadales bacterium]|jgi:predicted transcriptional regulator